MNYLLINYYLRILPCCHEGRDCFNGWMLMPYAFTICGDFAGKVRCVINVHWVAFQMCIASLCTCMSLTKLNSIFRIVCNFMMEKSSPLGTDADVHLPGSFTKAIIDNPPVSSTQLHPLECEHPKPCRLSHSTHLPPMSACDLLCYVPVKSQNLPIGGRKHGEAVLFIEDRGGKKQAPSTLLAAVCLYALSLISLVDAAGQWELHHLMCAHCMQALTFFILHLCLLLAPSLAKTSASVALSVQKKA